MNYDFIEKKQIKTNIDHCKNKLTDKYNRANSYSKKMMLSRELVDFSYLYKELFGYSSKLEWDNDSKINNGCNKITYKEFLKFVNIINKDNEFYFELSNSVINSFIDTKYPFYKYYRSCSFFSPKLDHEVMLKMILSFLNDYNCSMEEVKELFKSQLAEISLDNYSSGETFNFYSVNKNFVLLDGFLEDNIFKYETIIHEYGHLFEMKLSQNSNNNILINKSLETPYYEVSSCFFEYAFLNYLKDNRVYLNYVNQYFDDYFKEMLTYFFQINLISKFPNIEIDYDDTINLYDQKIIDYGNSIKNKLNYYELGEDDQKIPLKVPYIYGMGKLLSIYLYENYKNNPNFITEFKKSLLYYPLINDISAFNNLGINKDIILKGEVLKRELKRHYSDF